MIYAVRLEPGQTVLVEVGRASQIPPEKPDDEIVLRRVTPEYARRWVREGRLHETGLFVDDDGKVRYARSEKAKAEGEIHSTSDRSAPSCESTPRIDRTSDGAREPTNDRINLG